jgi:hypothetical protein
MTWVFFALSAGVIVLAAMRLAEYGDAIALRTRLSGMSSVRCCWREPLRCPSC